MRHYVIKSPKPRKTTTPCLSQPFCWDLIAEKEREREREIKNKREKSEIRIRKRKSWRGSYPTCGSTFLNFFLFQILKPCKSYNVDQEGVLDTLNITRINQGSNPKACYHALSRLRVAIPIELPHLLVATTSQLPLLRVVVASGFMWP